MLCWYDDRYEDVCFRKEKRENSNVLRSFDQILKMVL
jgi:hypothetical protein